MKTAADHLKTAEDFLGALGVPDTERAAVVPIVAVILKVCEDHGRLAAALERVAACNEKLLELARVPRPGA